MGKVYSWSAITEQGIPSPRDFENARQQALSKLSQLVEYGLIYGARIFGSVARGNPSIRSDLDLLVVFENDIAREELRKIFHDVYKETRVIVESTALKRELVDLGFHTIDPTFLEHFQYILKEGNIVGNDPLNLVRPQEGNVLNLHQQYLSQKLKRLTDGLLTPTKEEQLKILQRALEAPVNVGRRMLMTLRCLGILDLDEDDDSKEVIIRNYRRIFDEDNGLLQFNFLLESDRRYTRFLEETLQGQYIEEEYEEYLNSTERECLPQAISWVQGVSLKFHQSLEGNMKYGKENRIINSTTLGKERDFA